jgi:uncharacterized protein (TIGR03083 family)
VADRTFDPGDALAAYREAAHWWRSLVGGIDEHQWELHGLGEWNVRQLVAHGARAFRTVAEYVEGEPKDPTRIDTAAAYFRIVLAEQTPHLHIAERARREATETADWIGANDEHWAAAERALATTALEADVHLFVGEMALGQYLATRVVELVVHGLDLSAAIGIPSDPPVASARMAMEVLLDLAPPGDLSSLLRLVTGRPGSLPLDNALG